MPAVAVGSGLGCAKWSILEALVYPNYVPSFVPTGPVPVERLIDGYTATDITHAPAGLVPVERMIVRYALRRANVRQNRS